MTDEPDTFQLCQCGGCERHFAVEAFETAEQCPYCDSVVISASASQYQLIKQ